ncbi:MAG: glycosyltransferase family 4 protein [Candidatus Bathyarchaeia archaeon]
MWNLKILEVVHGFPPRNVAGVEVLTHNLSKELAKRHEIHVLYPIYLKGASKCYINSFKDKEEKIEIHELTIEENIWDYAKRLLRFDLIDLSHKNNRIRKKFEECLEEIQPDIVHFQHLKGLSIDLPLVAKKHCRVVLSLADYWPICPTTHFLNSDGEICNNPSPKNCGKCLSTIWCNLVSARRLINHRILKKTYESYGVNIARALIANRTTCLKQSVKCADKLLVVSETIIRKFTENGFINNSDLKDGKVALIHHGVDTHSLSEVRKNPSDNTRFGYVGTFGERKGLHVLIEAFNKLGDVSAELKIYGSNILDPSGRYHGCLIKKSKNNPKIKFMGPFYDVKDPYSNVDVLVVPSVTYEGYGSVVQEAFAAKTPVIASDIGALNESVEHMKNGLLFEVGNSDDLARKMRMVVENPILLRQLARSVPFVKSVEQNAKEIEEVYEEVIHGRGRSVRFTPLF